MPPKKTIGFSETTQKPKKRKEPPQSSNNQASSTNGRVKRVKTQDARTILTQTADAALNNGELDLQSFLKSREFEIKALQDGMQKSKKALTTRAFQQVPRDMRRRTASHNVQRVPKRLQRRAKREMKDDNTPTVDPSKRKPGGSRGRIRAETAKRLGLLASTKRAVKAKGPDAAGIATRIARPKVRKNLLNDPQIPKSKFRKRQIYKTWLPTHMWLAKRAKMTEPKNPLWRFSIPLSSTEKSYRPTHRATGARGAIAWDMSYMSTISLEGSTESLEKVLKAVGMAGQELWEKKGEKWRSGSRSWSGWLSREVKDQRVQVAPATVVWCAEPTIEDFPKKKPIRQLFIRTHPSAFLETWHELLRVSKFQRPAVLLQDLRFEIGSIDITGPGSTEALLGILNPYQQPGDAQEAHGQIFKSLAGVTNAASLPPNSTLAFSVADPRLKYPPKPASIPKPEDEDATFSLLQTISVWSADTTVMPSALFDRDSRFKATRLPSQKSLNRRKSQVRPGSYPAVVPSDPPIPIMLLTARANSSTSAQGIWTLLAPWKCILPIWHGLIHYPLSTGGNPRFGGLDEIRQIHFEHGMPWFPADFPGTDAGFAWEVEQRQAKKAYWDKRPKGKRTEWASLDLGAKRKGEIGQGWACDFENLLLPSAASTPQTPLAETKEGTQSKSDAKDASPVPEKPIHHLPLEEFNSLLSTPAADLPPSNSVATILVTLSARGVASPCARIYRLPAPFLRTTRPKEQVATIGPNDTKAPTPDIRKQWLSLIQPTTKCKAIPGPKSKIAKHYKRMDFSAPMPQRIRLLAQSLLENPPLPYPADGDGERHPLVPDEEDLIGFVTTGEFNLAEGKGIAVGTVLVDRAVVGVRRENKEETKGGRWCIVRNAGEEIGRLARWNPI